MQIVIDIPEEVYKEIQCGKMYHSVYDIPQESVKAIKNGTSLPKGHGRLIDARNLYASLFVKNGKVCPDRDVDNFPVAISVQEIKRTIKEVPTIMEADKGVD